MISRPGALKNVLLCLFVACSAEQLCAQTEIRLWPGIVPDEKNPKHPAELRDTLQKVRRITNITDPLLEVYRPIGKNLHASVIIAPGGGNKYLAYDLEGMEIAEWLAGLGYTAFVLQYRVPLNQTGALDDGLRAVRIVRSLASQYDLDANKVGIMGFSAGGNLSARVSTNYQKRLYEPVDRIDSVSARPDFTLLIYPGSLSTGPDHHLIPEIPVSTGTPPIFIFVASDDQFGPPFYLGQALKDNKIPLEFHVVPKGGHGYGLRKGNPAAETWPALAERWLAAIAGAGK